MKIEKTDILAVPGGGLTGWGTAALLFHSWVPGIIFTTTGILLIIIWAAFILRGSSRAAGNAASVREEEETTEWLSSLREQ